METISHQGVGINAAKWKMSGWDYLWSSGVSVIPEHKDKGVFLALLIAEPSALLCQHFWSNSKVISADIYEP